MSDVTYPLAGFDAGLPPEADLALAEPPAGTTGYGENHAFWCMDARNRVHSYAHIEDFQDCFRLRIERHWIALEDGTVLYDFSDGWRSTPQQPAGANLVFTCVEPFRRWEVDFLGTMRISSSAEQVKGRPVEGPRALVRYHLEVETAAPPAQSGRLPTAISDAAAMRIKGGVRYEQLTRVTGWFEIDGRRVELAGSGVRTHRRGTRDMAGWNGHSWQSALFPSGRGFHLSVFPGTPDIAGRATPRFSEGCIIEDGKLYPGYVVECSWLDTYAVRGDRSRVVLRAGEREAVIEAEVVASTWRTFHMDRSQGRYLRAFGVWRDPGSFANNQGAMRYVWDGEVTYGHAERSTAFELVREAPAGSGEQ